MYADPFGRVDAAALGGEIGGESSPGGTYSFRYADDTAPEYYQNMTKPFNTFADIFVRITT